MINQTKSTFPLTGWVGLGLIVISQLFCWMKLNPFYLFNTPICWTGFILLADSIIYHRKQESLIRTRTVEFVIMAVLSILLWMVFEVYNVLLKNWYYDGLPSNLWLRYFGYAWSFATIWPAVFEMAELLDLFIPKKNNEFKKNKITESFVFWTVLTGLICLIYPILYPSQYLFAYVWIGFILLLEPVNYTFNRPSLLADWEKGSTRKFWILMLAGYLCGILWEFWNYWALAKWHYTVPIGPNLHIFEMPVAGFLGFGPFAVECFVLYASVTGMPGWFKELNKQDEFNWSGILTRQNNTKREVES